MGRSWGGLGSCQRGLFLHSALLTARFIYDSEMNGATEVLLAGMWGAVENCPFPGPCWGSGGLWLCSLGQGRVLVKKGGRSGSVSGPVPMSHCSPDLFSCGPDKMCASQDKSQSHPRPDVTGLGPFWELPPSRPLSQSQIIKSADALTLQMRQEDLRASRLAADWPPCLGWRCQIL